MAQNLAGVKRIQPERLNIVRSYPSHPSKFIVVRMVIEVDPTLIQETLDGVDTGKPLTTDELVKVMQREMEQIKEIKYGIPTKLPDWFKAVDCAEIEENREDING
jgi:hypothetical protein